MVQMAKICWLSLSQLFFYIFLGSKITVDGDSSHETKRYLPFGRKIMIHLDSTFIKYKIF